MRKILRDKLVGVVRDAMAEHREEQARILHEQQKALKDELRRLEKRRQRNILEAAKREAVESSARFAYEQMPTARTFPNRDGTLRYALSLAPTDGLALQFGVWKGRTLRIIAEERGGKDVYGFDSFEGLPEAWRSGLQAGAFSLAEGGQPPQVPEVPGAEIVPGWFDETLEPFLEKQPGTVSFLHVDGDLYSSAVTVLDLVGPRLRPGSIIVFDEYFNYPSWEQGEYRAWQEYCAAHDVQYSYEGYSVSDEQVIVRLLG